MKLDILCDCGKGYQKLQESSVCCEREADLEYDLPKGAENVKIQFEPGKYLVHFLEIKGYTDFWYELAVQSDGVRLAENVYMMDEHGFEGKEFRYQTNKLKVKIEILQISEEVYRKIQREQEKCSAKIEELDTKWKYQIQVYDEKVEDVVQLERDKVELNKVIEELRGEREFWRTQYKAMENSSSWKITEPIRNMNSKLDGLKKRKAVAEKKKQYKSRVGEIGKEQARKELFAEHVAAELKFFEELAIKNSALRISETDTMPELADTRCTWDGTVTFVMFVEEQEPLDIYKTIGLLENQTKDKWQLLILDKDISGDKEIASMLRFYASADTRIVYRKVAKELTRDQLLAQIKQDITGDYMAVVEPGEYMAPQLLDSVKYKLINSPTAVYTDDAVYESELTKILQWNYKPDFSPDFLRSGDYIGQFVIANKDKMFAMLQRNEGRDIALDYYFLLKHSDERIEHVPCALYFKKQKSVAGQEVTEKAKKQQRALELDLLDRGIKAEVETNPYENTLFKIKYDILEQELISILIPSKDHSADLKRCIDSIREKSTYKNYEIIVIENNSSKKETFEYYDELKTKGIQVVTYQDEFNYAKINNYGVSFAKGKYVLLLNNDIEIITPSWMEEMLMYAQRENVGAVGCKLYYPNDTVQHAGVILGLGGVAAHSHTEFARDEKGYMNRLITVQNLTAVTAACLMMRRQVYEEIGGFDEGFKVAFNDVDFCMRIREKGYLIVFTPFAESYHYESISRGTEDTPEKQERFEGEVQLFKKKWYQQLEEGDPYYNCNLTSETEDFSLKE